MKRLPANKRNQLIGVIIATVGLICLVYFLLIMPQDAKNAELGANIAKETSRLAQYEKAIKQMEATTADLADRTRQLSRAESDVAAGDLYAWSVDTLRRFKTTYHVDIPNLSQPTAQSDCDLLGDFPYKQIRFSVAGAAYYHDLGKFVSDFENKFPHCRIVNLSAEPVGQASAGDKLNFRMDIIALVKPNN